MRWSCRCERAEVSSAAAEDAVDDVVCGTDVDDVGVVVDDNGVVVVVLRRGAEDERASAVDDVSDLS